MLEIDRRGFTKKAALASMGVVGARAFSSPLDTGGKPNIVVIITDQQHENAMSCAGNPWVKTPGMDAIAERGVRFKNAYVNLPVCLPQRYSLWTGRLPCTRADADPEDKPTISVGNTAKAAGYRTFYYGKWHVQDRTFARADTRHHGFDVHEGGVDPSTARNAAEFFASCRDEEPFFAVFSLYNPHDICEWGRKKSGVTERIRMRNGEMRTDPPLEMCPALPENFAIADDEAEAVGERRATSCQKMAMAWNGDTWRQYLWAYYRLVELADKRICEILEALEKSGCLDNTVLIFTSDHGDGMAAHRWHQKSILYDESLRVPFIVSYPVRGRRGEVDTRLVSTGIDFLATICDIVREPMPVGPYYGKSVLPRVLDRKHSAPGHTYVVSEAAVTALDGSRYEGRSVRTARYKYHVWTRGENREQLFDMQQDPGETKNLVGEQRCAHILAEHRPHFADWLRRTDDTYPIEVQ